MTENNNKKYEPYKIPGQRSIFEKETVKISHQANNNLSISFDDQMFAEIEIDEEINNSSKIARPVPQSQTIQPSTDKNRKMFDDMRQIARDSYAPTLLQSQFYDKEIQYENSKIFYKQALFMKDFEDNFTGNASLSSYFPYYQLMNYEQLRTYFTWRTKVKNGIINDTSISYAFIYIYELLNNIGVVDSKDGLDKIMSFWNIFRDYDNTIDRYVIKWIKDYHIYYELHESFKKFIYENNIQMHYPEVLLYESDISDNFELFSSISKYNIKQSSFYNDENCSLIKDCFYFIIYKLRYLFETINMNFDDLFFQPTKGLSPWNPFKGALFFPCLKGCDRKVIFSDKEIYIYSHNKWMNGSSVTVESGRLFISYVMKQMEAALRKVMNYKNKLIVNTVTGNNTIVQKLGSAGFSLEAIINSAVLEFYAEINKIVVSVNETTLKRIRLEALDTQEKLVVPEETQQIASDIIKEEPIITSPSLQYDEPAPVSDNWINLGEALSETEIKALAVILQDSGNIKKFADENGIMLEVLADSINEKAADHIGDSILEMDECMVIYDEYRERVMKMVRM